MNIKRNKWLKIIGFSVIVGVLISDYLVNIYYAIMYKLTLGLILSVIVLVFLLVVLIVGLVVLRKDLLGNAKDSN